MQWPSAQRIASLRKRVTPHCTYPQPVTLLREHVTTGSILAQHPPIYVAPACLAAYQLLPFPHSYRTKLLFSAGLPSAFCPH